MMQPTVKAFFDEPTNTISYVVWDPETRRAAIVDSLLDFDAASGTTSTCSADAMIHYIRAHTLVVDWILETHIHADHLSAAPYLKAQLGGRIGISDHVADVQKVFGKVFNTGDGLSGSGDEFDRLFTDGETFSVGNIQATALHTPGHTPACMTFVIGDAGFVGDTLFMPDFGTARCDFPGGDARQLYRSIKRIFDLPDETRLFMCHDYKAPGRDRYAWETTVKAERDGNVHVGGGMSEDAFVEMRTNRDATLKMPKLILPSVQVNLRAGEMPEAEENGVRYLKIPLNAF